MNCEDYRELLVALQDGELTPSEVTMVQSHLEQCAVCRTELEEIRTFSGEIRHATALFRDASHRIQSTIRPEKLSQRNRFIRPAWIGIAAALVVIAVIFYLRLSDADAEKMADWGVQHYALVDQTHPVAGDAETVKQWFLQHHNLSVVPPARIDYSHLSGCKVAELNSQQVPLLRLEEKPVKAVFILPDRSLRFSSNSISKDGFHVEFWREQNSVYMSVMRE